jgi:LPS-assembly protein
VFLPWTMTLWLAGQIPLATEAELPTGEKVMLAADQLLYEPATETLIAHGHTVLRTERMVVRADEIVYDQANQRALAKGNVMLVSGLLAAVADEVRVDVRTLEAQVQGGLLLRKKNVTPEQLLEAKTPHELKKMGETVFVLSGSRIKRIGPNEFLVDDLSFTPCDCDPTEPSWRVEARSAQVEIGERALLTSPAIYIYQVPIFWLPWLYLPLSDRRTGLLVPRPSYSALNGFSFEQPLFVTFGQSYDVTFTSGYYAGSSGGPQIFGIKGGRLHTELNYAPSERTSGRASLGLLYDVHPLRDALDPDPGLRVGGRRGLRGEASWRHSQDLGNGWRDRVDAGFVSDGYYLRDVTADVLLRQAEYLRSTAVLYRASEWSWFGADVLVRQQIWAERQRLGFDVLGHGRICTLDPDTKQCIGTENIGGPRTLARLPGVTYAIPERPIAGPLWAGVRAEYARLAPLTSIFGDEGTDGIFRADQVRATAACVAGAPAEVCPEPTQGNGQFDPGEREARDRLDLTPRLSLPFGLGRFARFTPYVGARETVYFGERTSAVAHRGYLLAGAAASTTLVGDLGPGKARHSITPHVEVRAMPREIGGVPGGESQAYDEVDLAVPAGGFVQGVAELRQDLGLRRDGAYRDLLRLDVGQGFELVSGRVAVAETFARTTLQEGPITLTGTARYDLPTRIVTQVAARADVNLGGGNAFSAAYDNLLVPETLIFPTAGAVDVPVDVGRDPLRPSLDALIGRPLSVELGRSPTHCDELRRAAKSESPPPLAEKLHCYSRAEQLVGGLSVATRFGLGVRYEAVVQPAASTKVPQQLIGLSYGPGCQCWRLEVHAWLRQAPPCPATIPNCSPGLLGSGLQPDFGASLTLHQFGSLGAGG